VSRATFVDREGTRRVVGVLCGFMRAHLDGIDEMLRTDRDVVRNGPGMLGGSAQNTVFYAVAQAVFLIFCFRWRDLMDGEEEEDVHAGKRKWMPELSVLQRSVISVLNPLRDCSRNVVMQFARIARATAFLYCYSILETNKRSESFALSSSVAGASEGVSSTGANNIHSALLNGMIDSEVNSFFPFDPYRLPKSRVYIEGVYREWSSVALDDEDEEEEEEDEGSEADDVDEPPERLAGSGYLAIPRSTGKLGEEDENGLGQSLDAMSISPSVDSSVRIRA